MDHLDELAKESVFSGDADSLLQGLQELPPKESERSEAPLRLRKTDPPVSFEILKPHIIALARKTYKEHSEEDEAAIDDAVAEAVAEMLQSANYGVVEFGGDGDSEVYVTGHDGNMSFRLSIPSSVFMEESEDVRVQFGPIDAVVSQRDLLRYWASLVE